MNFVTPPGRNCESNGYQNKVLNDHMVCNTFRWQNDVHSEIHSTTAFFERFLMLIKHDKSIGYVTKMFFTFSVAT